MIYTGVNIGWVVEVCQEKTKKKIYAKETAWAKKSQTSCTGGHISYDYSAS